ncbi:MAG: ribonuclease HI [Gemmatimonadaceae bacterium]|nr:ribonuclease HI [Gemmatimonadaceae bacterium]
MTADQSLVAVYADESCLGNGREGDNPGGAGGLVEWRKPGSSVTQRWDFWISDPGTTNNRMALRSVSEAFRGLSGKGKSLRVVFTTDSRYIVDGMNSWVHGWIERGWRRKAGPIENLELWKEAISSIAPHQVEWRWVRGHRGHPQNEYANFLATRAAAEQTSSSGFVVSEFDEWIADKGKATKLTEASPFPDEGTFQPGRRIWTT